MERKAFGSRRRFEFYAYLGAVYALYGLLRRKNEAKISAHRIAKLFGIRTQKRTHAIRVIIDASSAAEEKTRSRWCRALRHCWRERKNWTDLGTLFSEVGGPAGAAARWSALRMRKGSGQVGPDTQDLVPEVPLIVDTPLLEPGRLFAVGGRVFRQPDAAEADPQLNRETRPPGKS
jgi:hypothetical protein